MYDELATMGGCNPVTVVYCPDRMGNLCFFRRTKENGNPCANCVTGCDLKRLMDEKHAECSATKKEKKKKCCG